MKKNWPILVLAAVLVAFGIYYFTFSSKPATPDAPTENDLPMLTTKNLDGGAQFLYELTGKTLLIFFSPDCDHCQREAKQISQQKQIFKYYQLYFISSDSLKNIVNFAQEYDLVEPNFHFSQADNYDVYKTVGDMPSIPAIFIYNNKKLVKRFDGEVKLEEMMKFL